MEKRHRIDRLNRWLTFGANLGVVLGLIILIVEVRHNADLTRAQMESGKNDLLAQIELSLATPYAGAARIKSIRSPEDMSDLEIRMVESHLVALMLQWDHMFNMERIGLVSRVEAQQHILNTAQYYFGSRHAKNWWRLQQPGWEGTPMTDRISNLMRNTTMQRIYLALFTLSMAYAVQADTGEATQTYGQVALVPADRSLARPEDGVMLGDGTLLIADQEHGLVALSPDGAKRPFGDFKAAGYIHEPPARIAGPNGVALEPGGIHVLVADVLTGAIYRVNSRSEQVVRIHQHEFGVNSVRRDRSGAIWFTQSTENNGPDSEARMFAAVDTKPMDGALFRLSPTNDHEPFPELRRMDSGLDFANGLAIDEKRGYLYVAETMADRIIGYRLSVPTGRLSNRRVIAEVPTPDNIELDAAGRLWVASPIANALLVVDPESGEWSTAFHPQTEEHDRLMVEWRRRTESGEPRLELFGPDMWSPLPGLVTGMILTSEGGPIYLTGLGDALVQLTNSE